MAYHVLNRANGRLRIFKRPDDFEAFERALEEAQERFGTRVCAYTLLSNHWHLVLWPKADGELSRFVGWLTLTHTQRWHAFRRNAGTGHVYQGRFKSFPIQEDEHFLAVCRYVERNPLRADLVERAEEWRWSSLWRWKFGDAQQKSLLSGWPVARPSRWLEHVNRPQTEAEEAAIRRSLQRGSPYGDAHWTERTAQRLGLQSTLRPRGRPRIRDNGSGHLYFSSVHAAPTRASKNP
jgi:putative transposase